jgi:hypothetical protein
MIDFTEIKNGEKWELFARDFLSENGFYIESAPDRGPDGKKDLIISENLKGNLGNYKFTWLVSCKHYANSKKSVTEKDEPNVLDRIKSFNCDGFIGFYSTIPSSGLNTRLNKLKDKGNIKDYRVYDHKLLENYLLTIGYSITLMRYFPISYKNIKPLHILYNEYLPLNCKKCNTDLLIKIYDNDYSGIICLVEKGIDFKSKIDNNDLIEDLYWVCKGGCDIEIEAQLVKEKKITSWKDIGDLVNPSYFMKWLLSILNSIESGKDKFSKDAFEKLKYFILAISQKVIREMTQREVYKFNELVNFDKYII